MTKNLVAKNLEGIFVSGNVFGLLVPLVRHQGIFIYPFIDNVEK